MDEHQLSTQREPIGPPTGAARWLLFAGVMAIAGVAALGIDRQVAAWCINGNMPGDLKKIFDFSEAFGHGTGIVLILITMFVLDPVHRRMMPRMIACLISAAIGANLVKMLVARYRPRAFGTEIGFDHSIFESFHALFPFGDGGHSLQGFPSAHTTGAVALACSLAMVYPRGRWWFATLAAFVAMQRISSGAHFVSDTCFGAALGLLISTFFWKVGPFAPRQEEVVSS